MIKKCQLCGGKCKRIRQSAQKYKLNICLLYTSCWYEDRGNGLVKHLVLEDAARGKGVGTLLLKYAEDEMVSRGISKCVLNARISVTGFYEKLG